jgi:hypothetical protein
MEDDEKWRHGWVLSGFWDGGGGGSVLYINV